MDLTLQMMGFLGEGHSGDDSVWVTKTHHPWDFVLTYPFNADKMIYLMRNPIDSIPSLMHLVNTNSHSIVPTEDIEKEFP